MTRENTSLRMLVAGESGYWTAHCQRNVLE